MANILFEYLYRDAGNNKQHGQAIFSNPGGIHLADIEAQIRATLHDGQWFKAEMVDLETCFFSRYPTEEDHPWHEFDGVSETDLPASDPASPVRRDIAQFLEDMRTGYALGWTGEDE